MSRKLPPLAGKQRTREHVLADLSVNHVERFALRCGFAVQRLSPDYGLDLEIITFDSDGFREAGAVLMQVKATDHLKKSKDGRTVSIRIERRDILAWMQEAYLVILAVYDAVSDVAYYLAVNNFFGGTDIFARLKGQTITVRIPTDNVINAEATRQFAQEKLATLPSQGAHS